MVNNQVTKKKRREWWYSEEGDSFADGEGEDLVGDLLRGRELGKRGADNSPRKSGTSGSKISETHLIAASKLWTAEFSIGRAVMGGTADLKIAATGDEMGSVYSCRLHLGR